MVMQLWDYLQRHGLTQVEFAKRIGVGKNTVYRYTTGERFPNKRVMRRITDETKGKVTASDFMKLMESQG